MSKSGIFSRSLSNGVQVIGESFDNVQSVSIGFFLKSGVVFETPKNQGISHFIEHMLFKGTERRSARDIARQFDRIGGYLNAFTAKDYCCYYARVVSDKLPVAVDILSDMVGNSLFDEAELERERGVIMEEIKMYEDSPDEIIHELLGQQLWGNSSLGRPILGTNETVGSFSRDEILRVYREQYIAENLLVAVAGNFDEEKLIRMLEKRLAGFRRGSFCPRQRAPKAKFGVALHQKEIEQLHLALGTEGTRYDDPARHAVFLLNTAFGGGMSSRLFQEIREKRGLAYSVYSYHTSFRHTGFFAIYAGLSEANLGRVLALIVQELDRLHQRGLTKTELKEAKDQVKGNLLMALESSTNRMNRLITGFLYDVPPREAEEAIEPLMKVTVEEITEAARRLFDPKRMAVTIISSSAAVKDIVARSAFGRHPVQIVVSPKDAKEKQN
jgi:predicted Zn-dependent peptidase